MAIKAARAALTTDGSTFSFSARMSKGYRQQRFDWSLKRDYGCRCSRTLGDDHGQDF